MALTKTRRLLLIQMEGIVGSQCWNRWTRNGPSTSGEGRGFRYPIQIPSKKGWERSHCVTAKTSDAQLLKSRYFFGANELLIFRALDRVLTHLEKNHGLRIEEPSLGDTQGTPPKEEA